MGASTCDPGEPGLWRLGRGLLLDLVRPRAGEWLPCGHDKAGLVVAIFLIWLHCMLGTEHGGRARRRRCRVLVHGCRSGQRQGGRRAVDSGTIAVVAVGMSGSAATHEAHGTEETAIHHMPAPAKSDAAHDAEDGFNDLNY